MIRFSRAIHNQTSQKSRVPKEMLELEEELFSLYVLLYARPLSEQQFTPCISLSQKPIELSEEDRSEEAHEDELIRLNMVAQPTT